MHSFLPSSGTVRRGPMDALPPQGQSGRRKKTVCEGRHVQALPGLPCAPSPWLRLAAGEHRARRGRACDFLYPVSARDIAYNGRSSFRCLRHRSGGRAAMQQRARFRGNGAECSGDQQCDGNRSERAQQLAALRSGFDRAELNCLPRGATAQRGRQWWRSACAGEEHSLGIAPLHRHEGVPLGALVEPGQEVRFLRLEFGVKRAVLHRDV